MRSISLMMTVTAMVTGLAVAPPCVADPTVDTLSAAVTAARGSCGPLRQDPLAQQAAEIVLRSTDTYLINEARRVPVEDAAPILQDLGLPATKSKVLQGAGETAADAIRFILVSGYAAIPDCGYTDYGGAMTYNHLSGFYLTAVVLAGA